MKIFNKFLLLIVLLLSNNILFSATIESSIGFQSDFEDSSEREKWHLNTGAFGSECANQWYWGKVGANGGEHGLYISGDGGTSNYYTPTGTTVLAYREYTFDKGNYELSFDWQAGGLQTDGLYVCWIPVRDSIKLNSVSMSSLLPEWVERYSIDFDRATPYLSQTTWNTVLDTIYTNGEAYNLVFVWNNSVLAYSSLGAAIDNLVILQEGRCSRPTDLKANPKGDDMVLSWQGSADAYDVRCRNNLTGEVVEYNDVTEKHQVISDLPEGMCTYFVRSKCDGIAGAWSTISKFLFYPGSHCIDFLDLNKENCSYGNAAAGGGIEKGVVDFGCQSVDSRHTIHWNPEERDPFTLGKLRTVPEGELASVRLGNWNIGADFESVQYNYLVDTTKDAAVLLLNYAVVLESPNHDSLSQPRFTLEITYQGRPLDKFGCGEANFAAGFNTQDWVKFQGTNSEGYYKDWTTIAINLGKYHGKSLKIKLTTYDCTAGGHFGYAYFTLGCTDGKIKGLSCGDDSETIFQGPDGFKYRWYLEDEPGRIISTKQTLKLPANDTLTYNLDVIQPTNINCYYTLRASAVGRYPKAKVDFKHKPTGCKNMVEFVNQSHVIRVNQVSNVETETAEPCEDYYWDFGDGTVSYEANPVHEYPETGGIYQVKFSAGLAEGKCKDDTTFTVVLPRMGVYRDTINETICFGQSYPFKGENLFESGLYSDTTLSIWGCDSIAVLNLTVVDDYDITKNDTICSGEEYYFDGKPITETGRYKAKFKSQGGCDSIVTLDIVVYETLDLSVPSVINHCKNEEYISIPYVLNSGRLDEFKLYFEDVALECEGYSVESDALLVEFPTDLTPNSYRAMLKFGERSCGKEFENVTLNVLYPREVIVQRWGDVLAVTNEDYNGGYEFVAFQWYKNGVAIDSATSSILYVPEGLDLSAEYSVMLTREDDNVTLMTCSAQLIDFGNETEKQVVIFSRDEVMDVEVPQNSRMKVWSTSGVLLKDYAITEGFNSVSTLGLNGMYILEFIFEDNSREIQQVVL